MRTAGRIDTGFLVPPRWPEPDWLTGDLLALDLPSGRFGLVYGFEPKAVLVGRP